MLAGLAGCSDGNSSGGVTTVGSNASGAERGGGGGSRVAARYQEFASCDDLLNWAQEQMLARVTPYGLDGWYWYGGPVPVADGSAVRTDVAEATMPAAAQDDSAGSGTSATNTQESGVDEGDLAETDGRFVYTLIGGALRSVDLDTGAVVSDLAIPNGATQMILSGNRLAVVGQDWSSGDTDTIVSVYGIEAGVLTLLHRTHLEGNLISVRSVDGAVRVVLDQPFATRLPFVQPRRGGRDEERDALEQNEDVIEAATIDQLLPRQYVEGPNGGSATPTAALDCAEVGHPREFSGLATTWVATIDLASADAAAVGAAGVIATAQTVYSSADRLYVATIAGDDLTSDTVPVRPGPARTAIHSFDLRAPDGADYLASGEVEGTVLNSYAMSEHAGMLRVATTTSAGGFGQSQESGVHVFEHRGAELVEIGTLGGLGRTEQIQGVRFLGDRGYVVTFRQIDPLFVIDLSDPTAPTLKGELKVPGFSTYLHPIDDGQLLAIGFEGTESGQILGTQLSLFDVSDPAAPALLDTLRVGDFSEATFDPHAFLYWPETGTVVVPTQAPCTPDGQQTDEWKMCSTSVVGAVAQGQLSEQGRLDNGGYVQRSMVADGRLVTIGDEGVRLFDIATLGPIGHIPFAG